MTEFVFFFDCKKQGTRMFPTNPIIPTATSGKNIASLMEDGRGVKTNTLLVRPVPYTATDELVGGRLEDRLIPCIFCMWSNRNNLGNK